MIRVFVVDDHPVVVQGTVTYLGAEADMEVVGHATEGADALDAVAELAPDVVVLDLQIPGVQGFDLLKKLASSGFPVVIFSLYAEGAMASRALEAGGRWAVPKSADLTVLAGAVRSVANGKTMTPTAAEDLVATLSQRERQIFSHIIGGSPLKVIAADLGLSTGTVHTYAHRIRSKLGVGTVPDIVRYAHSRGLHLTSEEG